MGNARGTHRRIAYTIIPGDQQKKLKPKNDPACEGCAYYTRMGGFKQMCCGYLDMTGHVRGCPPGEGCTKRTAGAPEKKKGWAYYD